MRLPSATLLGALTVAVGAVWSVDWLAAASVAIRVAGCTPMSAKRLTVACCMLRSGVLLSGLRSSRPQDHCTVPAPKTSAPLGALYSVMLCVWVELGSVTLPQS